MMYYPKTMATAILQGIYNVGLSLEPSMAEMCVGRTCVEVTFFFYGQDRSDEFIRVLRHMMVDGMTQSVHHINTTDCTTLVYSLKLGNESAETGER